MDPRQPPPQLPFSRNAASPFTRPSFPPAPPTATATSQPPYPPASSHPSHAPSSTAGPYSDMHARKPSDPPPYYAASRQYPPEAGPGPMTAPSHSRHHSTSSITSGPTMTRGMPPPSSPPQQQQQQQQGPQQQGQGPNPHQMAGPYSLPQPRPPPVSVGPPSAFPRGRELPALDSLPRTGSSGSSMSISSMLGGPPPAREGPPPHQYSPASGPTAAPGPPYNPSLHASPRTQAEYAAFRRPQTPEHHRMYENRNQRPAGVASPPAAYSSTPEVPRYGTPQTYPPRGPPLPAAEPSREPGRMSGSTMPPRTASPPKQYPGVGPQRQVEPGRPPTEMYASREELRPSEEYNPERPIRVMQYDEQRYMADRERQERERQEREMELRERERRDMAMSGVEPSRPHGMHPQEFARQMEQRVPPYGRPPDMRDQGHWSRPGYESARAPYDPAMHMQRHQDYPPTTSPHYNGQHPYSQGPVDRHHPSSQLHHQHGIPPPGPAHPQSYDSPDRQRMSVMHLDRPQPQQHPPRTREEAAVPPPSVAYGGVGPSMYDSPRNRTMEEMGAPHQHQRNLLGIQEINRKGRISPLPQAVQGAQPQIAGPAGEPGIKSEFGRMFSGIGSGVGTLSSPVPAGAQVAYGPSGLLRRDEMDGMPEDSPVETAKPGRGKRRKLKDEEVRDDEGSTGRLTPVGGRAKKSKGHAHQHAHHHHQYVSSLSSF